MRVAVSTTDTKTLRRDAQRNRERILAAARALLARDGVDASVEEITREAGVGMGTLYRHFPTKADLVDAVLEDAFAEIVQAAEEAAAVRGRAGRASPSFLERALALHAANRGLKDVLASSEQGRERAEAMRARLRPLLRQVIDRAQAQGTLRAGLRRRGHAASLFWTSGRVIEVDGERRARLLAPLPRPSCSTGCAPSRRRRCRRRR